MTNLEIAATLVNKWVSMCMFLPPKEQGTTLIRLIANYLDNVELEILNLDDSEGDNHGNS